LAIQGGLGCILASFSANEQDPSPSVREDPVAHVVDGLLPRAQHRVQLRAPIERRAVRDHQVRIPIAALDGMDQTTGIAHRARRQGPSVDIAHPRRPAARAGRHARDAQQTASSEHAASLLSQPTGATS